MKKTIKTLLCTTAISLSVIMVSYASEGQLTQSARWVGTGDRWQVSDNNGGYIKNDWFQDDVTGHWYLLGDEDGSVMYAGLTTDQATGKSYLLNPNHDGTYGRMLCTDGVYSLNGHNVYMTFNQNHDGTYGAITSNVDEVRATGVSEKQINSANNASTSTSENTQTNPSNPSQTTQSNNSDIPRKPDGTPDFSKMTEEELYEWYNATHEGSEAAYNVGLKDPKDWTTGLHN